MNKLERQVAESTYWKKDANYCAKRIGISVEKYIKIKKQIKNKNKP